MSSENIIKITLGVIALTLLTSASLFLVKEYEKLAEKAVKRNMEIMRILNNE